MFLQVFNKHHISHTSLSSKVFLLSVDFISSVIDPDQVFVGGLNFALDVFSVVGGFVTRGLVCISDVE